MVEIRRSPVEVGSLSHYIFTYIYKVLAPSQVVSRISAINSSFPTVRQQMLK